jgi:hypothetical protein
MQILKNHYEDFASRADLDGIVRTVESLLLMFVKLVLLITFIWCIFSQLFQRIRNQREILRFLTPFFDFLPKKIFFWPYYYFFSNFEAKRAKNGSKNQKTYLVNVS